ncbi:hypothetical protein [Chitinophaga pinensis]|uniref:Uncharacterized protein n=1 Tax=Chitinophaga pinensis (strain ATCC 43595 / DSM 2588 / LMG 13176 / NBRC 15968 / NCIMB 11800 / UQM 2034) TaxID=485918 RepID=A0A979G361_CHIPD|nr:hypothetical protein [Chitinophaga pinensis]ACU59713.1 hypothetical protein Cpin_2222 [Chitinophaga pinensis DSM 2588]
MRYLLRRVYLLIIFCCCMLTASAQKDKWVGTWSMDYKPWPTTGGIKMQLQIGNPVYNTLYPAQLKLIYPPFSGTYEVLLAKKNDKQLGIGRNKYPVAEEPFRLGAWMLYLNGTLSYEAKSTPELSIQRMWINSYDLYMQGLYADDEIYAYMKDLLRELLSRKEIALKKINNTPWQHRDIRRILHPEGDSIYFGIYDKVDIYDSIVPLSIRDEDAIDKDTVTLLHNGKVLLDKAYITETGKVFQLPLDTGINIITLFADNYGRLPPNTGAFRVKSSTGGYIYDFTDRPNRYATFLVAQLNRVPRKPVIDSTAQQINLNKLSADGRQGTTNTVNTKVTGNRPSTINGKMISSQEHTTAATSGQQTSSSDTDDSQSDGSTAVSTATQQDNISALNGKHSAHPEWDTIKPVLLKPINDKRITERRNSLLEKTFEVNESEIMLELWDDAAEDGDSISIRLNGQEVVTGFPVKKKRQQLKVTLQEGENRLIMVADNLGSIPPNTAVLRIVAGALRRFVSIKTNMKQNNMLLIVYEPPPVSTGKSGKGKSRKK